MTEVVLKTLKVELKKKCDQCYDGFMVYSDGHDTVYDVEQKHHICDKCGATGKYCKEYPVVESHDVTFP